MLHVEGLRCAGETVETWSGGVRKKAASRIDDQRRGGALLRLREQRRCSPTSGLWAGWETHE